MAARSSKEREGKNERWENLWTVSDVARFQLGCHVAVLQWKMRYLWFVDMAFIN